MKKLVFVLVLLGVSLVYGAESQTMLIPQPIYSPKIIEGEPELSPMVLLLSRSALLNQNGIQINCFLVTSGR